MKESKISKKYEWKSWEKEDTFPHILKIKSASFWNFREINLRESSFKRFFKIL